MRLISGSAFALLMLLPSSASSGDYLRAKELRSLCSSTKGLPFCRGFIIGAVDANLDRYELSKKFCLPKGLSGVALADRIVRAVRSNPYVESISASGAVHAALVMEFPC